MRATLWLFRVRAADFARRAWAGACARPRLQPSDLAYDKPLCASLDGFTLHAATRAGALDTAGREALLRYVLRPPVAQERVATQKDGLVAITLKRAYADGTVAVEMDPLSLLCRLAMSVPPPRYHTVKYAGVIAPASKWRAQIAVAPPESDPTTENIEAIDEAQPPRRQGTYRAWADLLKRTFDFDVLRCTTCGGRMKLLAMVTAPKNIARYLRAIGEPTDTPGRSPSRGPPYWKSTVLRKKALHDVA
jgi:Putative transposase